MQITTISTQVDLALDETKSKLLREQRLKISRLEKEIGELKSNIDSMHDLHIELEKNLEKKKNKIDFLVKNLSKLDIELQKTAKCYATGYCLGLIQSILLNLQKM